MDDQPFRHYSNKHRIVAWISENLFDRVTYTARRGLVRGMRRKGGLGWLPELRWTETAEQRFWRNLSLKGLVVYDVGAFQGLLSLFFSRQAKQVISYESNRKNYGRILENIRLNNIRNITVRNLGVGSAAGNATMVFSPLMPGGASLDPGIASQIERLDVKARSERIRVTTLDQDIAEASLPPPDFIKIDIEGMELEALKGARHTLQRYTPALFLEMHGETMNEKRRKAAEIVAFLHELGYQDVRHVESAAPIAPANSAEAAQGHLYCARG